MDSKAGQKAETKQLILLSDYINNHCVVCCMTNISATGPFAFAQIYYINA